MELPSCPTNFRTKKTRSELWILTINNKHVLLNVSKKEERAFTKKLFATMIQVLDIAILGEGLKDIILQQGGKATEIHFLVNAVIHSYSFMNQQEGYGHKRKQMKDNDNHRKQYKSYRIYHTGNLIRKIAIF